MGCIAVSTSEIAASWAEPLSGIGPNWYAAYTRPRHEKNVANLLQQKGLELYLPLYSTVHRWNQRRVRLELPLFPGYVFVRLPLANRAQVLTTRGVISLVGRGGCPTPLLEREIEAIRKYLSLRLPAEPFPDVAIGKRVRVVAGPLAGLEGTVLRRKGGLRIVIRIELIMRSVIMEVAASDITALRR